MIGRRWRPFWFALWCTGMALGIYLSLRPGTMSAPLIPHLDKAIHAAGYGLLAALAVSLFRTAGPRVCALSAVLLLGGAIEIAQGLWAVNRAAEFADLLANAAGIVLGSAVFWRRDPLKLDPEEGAGPAV